MAGVNKVIEVTQDLLDSITAQFDATRQKIDGATSKAVFDADNGVTIAIIKGKRSDIDVTYEKQFVESRVNFRKEQK